MTRRKTVIAGLVVLGAVATAFLIPAVRQAREAARRAENHSHLFQHSGHHPYILVHLDRNLKIKQIGICPLCYEEGCPTYYSIDGTKEHPIPQDITPSKELEEEAKRQIREKLADPTFQRTRSNVRRFVRTNR